MELSVLWDFQIYGTFSFMELSVLWNFQFYGTFSSVNKVAYLWEVEYDIRVSVLAGHDVGPELPHEEHLVRELRRTCTKCRENKI
jgi:hypothetical protein